MPIVRKLSSRARQDRGSESFDVNGRENEETPVVDDVLQITRALFRVPSNPLVARRDFPCRTGPQQASQNLAIAGFDEVPEMSVERNTAAEIMETFDELTPQPAVGCIHQRQAQRLQLCDGRMNGWWSIQINRNPAWTAVAGWAQRR